MSRGPATFRQQDVTRMAKALKRAGVPILRTDYDLRTGKASFHHVQTATPIDDLDRELEEFEADRGPR